MTNDVKPLVPTGIVTEFGELKDVPDRLFDEQGMNSDPTYVPGFTDMRRAADIARANGKKPLPLPVNLRWVRRTRPGTDTPTNERQIWVGNRGYKPVRADQVGTVPWLTAMPAGAHKLPDGTIGNMDGQLMVCDQDRAMRNSAAKTVKWLEQNTGSAKAALEAAGLKEPGARPEITVEVAAPRK